MICLWLRLTMFQWDSLSVYKLNLYTYSMGNHSRHKRLTSSKSVGHKNRTWTSFRSPSLIVIQLFLHHDKLDLLKKYYNIGRQSIKLQTRGASGWTSTIARSARAKLPPFLNCWQDWKPLYFRARVTSGAARLGSVRGRLLGPRIDEYSGRTQMPDLYVNSKMGTCLLFFEITE